jgi:hypothetical protein
MLLGTGLRPSLRRNFRAAPDHERTPTIASIPDPPGGSLWHHSAMTTHRLSGHCHCNQMTLELATAIAPEKLALRACQCSFCRRHGARTTSDPAGALRIVLKNCEAVSYYQFGPQTAEFLVCQRCGSYVAALVRDGDRVYATVNANTFDTPILQAAEPMDFDNESAEQRLERRRSSWTPAFIVENWGTFSERRIR